jgi:hypothetical protein
MNFAKFWARGKFRGFVAWGWSNASVAEAEAMGCARAERIAERLARNELRGRSYLYGMDRPMRELVLREFPDDTGKLAGVITRNSYGCDVLNTAQIMFIDVDVPEPRARPGIGGFLGSLFGRPNKQAPEKHADDAKSELLARAKQTVDRDSSWGWRIYKTRAGFRLLATHRLFDPVEATSDDLFEHLGADPLYRKLCQTQKCFRARLTPKPYRCEIRNPPDGWPWPDQKSHDRYKAWENKYSTAAKTFATCELITSMGNPQTHASINPIIAVHDQMTRVGTKLPLA